MFQVAAYTVLYCYLHHKIQYKHAVHSLSHSFSILLILYWVVIPGKYGQFENIMSLSLDGARESIKNRKNMPNPCTQTQPLPLTLEIKVHYYVTIMQPPTPPPNTCNTEQKRT